MNKTIAVISLWRDSQNYIYTSLRQLTAQEEELGTDYSFFYSFYENDSVDDTPEILREWLNDRQGILLTEKRNDPKWESVPSTSRTDAMAQYRNSCLYSLRYKKYDYLFVIDSDIYYDRHLFKSMIKLMDNNKMYGMITPNTQQNVSDKFNFNKLTSYYDSWALIDLQGNKGLSFAFNPFITISDRCKWDKSLPIMVASAFGGISLVRGDLLQEKKLIWNGDNGCEHWYFCEKIREMNYLIVVHPLLSAEVRHVNSVRPDLFLLIFDKLRLVKNSFRKTSLKNRLKNIIIIFALYIFNLLFSLKKYISKMIKFFL